MELKITNKVITEFPKDKFEIVLNFSETDLVSKMLFKKDAKSKIFKWVTLFKEYRNKLDKDSNIEIGNIMDISDKFNLAFHVDDIIDSWKYNPERECLYILSHLKIYYYNEDGLKFNVEVN